MSGKSNRRFEAGGGAGVDALRFRQTREHSTSACAGRQVYNAQGKVVGIICGGVFRKLLDPTRHKLRQPSGWAVDAGHLTLDWHTLRIEATDGSTWLASRAAFLQHGIALNRGHGDQVCLPDLYWTVRRAGQPEQLPLLPLEEARP